MSRRPPRGLVARVVPAVTALLLAGCGGRGEPPPQPDRALVPESVALARSWGFDGCNGLVVRLATSAEVTVHRPGITTEGCTVEPTPYLFGSSARTARP